LYPESEFVTKYFHKGSSICIVGSIQTRNWEDQQGQKRYSTEVLADEISFVDSKSDSSYSAPAQTEQAAPQFSTPSTEPAPNFEEITGDDDLPF